MDRLKRARATIKGKLTRVDHYVDAVNPDNSVRKQELRSRLQYLESVWNEYTVNHSLILDVVGDDDLAAEETDFADTEGRYLLIQSKIQLFIDDDDSESDYQSTPSSPSRPVRQLAHIKLPRLDLPKFSGNILEWTSFNDLFTSMVHQQQISNSQKLQYLKTSVTGEAESLIQSIDVTDANYAEAWKLLQDRYENKRQLIQCQLHSLFMQPSLKEESSLNLRKLLDHTTKCIRALTVMGEPTDNWDSILVYTVTDRLDADSRRHWELSSPDTSYPKFEKLKEYIEQRCRALDAANKSKYKGQPSGSTKAVSTHHSSFSQSCSVCQEQHQLYQCSKFTAMDIKQRKEAVRKNNLCYNCLRSNHSVKKCNSKSTCRECGSKHHTLLHQSQQQSTPTTPRAATEPLVASHYSDHNSITPVLLSTAIVRVEDSSGGNQQCRILLDGGSQASFITEACVRRLGLKRTRASIPINGIGNSVSKCTKGKVNLIIKSRDPLHSNSTVRVNALILSMLTGQIPSVSLEDTDWTYLRGINLADPSFFKPGGIDILLGADCCDDVVRDGKIAGPPGFPMARNTNLGWVVSGQVKSSPTTLLMSHVSTMDLDVQLKKFWELEEVPTSSRLSKDEQDCEDHFKRTHTRDSAGRYVTSLPFRDLDLGYSKGMALKRLHSVERRLSNDKHREQYEEFMDEYLRLGHMEPVPSAVQKEVINKTNYLPHHYVLKESSTTTSLRVVFDASANTSNGKSLNSNLLVGPTIQDDMWNILLRFRCNKYAFTADIAKMYRQIKVTPEDSDFLRILWRKDPKAEVEEYRLLTVTYGTASAPHTATRTLHQIAHDRGDEFPLAKFTVLRDFYVDDLMSGRNNIDIALATQSQLIRLLKTAGLVLRKWSSNDPRLLESIPEDYRETKIPISLDSEDSIKALGLHWNTGTDQFFFKVNLPTTTADVTKRIILSETAKLYDPMGWLSPVVINAKILFQHLWTAGLGWDSQLPPELHQRWTDFRSEVFDLEKLYIPRYVGCHELPGNHQLHGFSDASEAAYGAVVYLRSETPDGKIHVNLITSKTKVSPVKQISIPKLELCGAFLLSALISKVKGSLHIKLDSTMGWTDSTVVLGWISGYPNKWKTFVANRVSQIQDSIPPSHWRHVPGKDNPADLCSRGISPTQLIESNLWWKGPTWLSKPSDHWPSMMSVKPTTEEVRTPSVSVAHCSVNLDMMNGFSSLSKLIRITSLVFRFINLTRKLNSYPKIISTNEMNESTNFWIKKVQQAQFADSMNSIKKNKPVSSQLSSLSPFLDDDGVLRVGGRLTFSSLPVNQKHPAILPKTCHLSSLIIQQHHENLLHAGPTLTMSMIRRRYWILGIRSLVRQHVHKCTKCIRDRATTMTQMMGSLPFVRVNPGRPFLRSGVDFAGPFQVKQFKGRGGKIHKAYLCVFVCLSTKAIHLELVTDLSAEAFLAALRRLNGRRGRCMELLSDNGSNFIGANNELKKMTNQMLSTTTMNMMTHEGTEWKFIPPRGPHFGGLWESAVKSAKSHLHRVIGATILTYEEMVTVLCQIEGCLNSRPLCPISSSPDDLNALTPGHFLIGDAITAFPEPSLMDVPMNRLSRWQLMVQINQHFWKRWSLEYLNTLQQRNKWKLPQRNLLIDDLVLVKEDNIPPMKWLMGRVIQLHPGVDKCVRVATLKTINGIIKRPVVKLVLLISDSTETIN